MSTAGSGVELGCWSEPCFCCADGLSPLLAGVISVHLRRFLRL